MKNTAQLALIRTVWSASLLLAGMSVGYAQTVAPVQSAVRPFGLNIVSKVMAAGSDAKSATFQQNSLKKLRNLAMLNLPEGKPLSNKTIGLHRLDPEKIKLSTAADVRCYFIGEGAGYHNTFGFNPAGSGITSGNPKLIFPDASSNIANTSSNVNGTRSSNAPLLPGDFVDLGKFNGGTQLNFFNISDGANGGRTVFTTQHNANPDGLVHAVAYALPDSPYLLIGFEDLWGGGDKDYNDVLFTLDVGLANVARLSGPEPTMTLTLGAFLAVVVLLWQRQRRNDSLYVRA